MIILQNNNLIVELKELGGELVRIYSKKSNKEILWSGNKDY